MDDKLCAFSALWALRNVTEIASTQDNSTNQKSRGSIHLVALFDTEEIGSVLRVGAKSDFLKSVIERVVEIQIGVPANRRVATVKVMLCYAY